MMVVPAGDLLPGKDWMMLYIDTGYLVVVSDTADVAAVVADIWELATLPTPAATLVRAS